MQSSLSCIEASAHVTDGNSRYTRILIMRVDALFQVRYRGVELRCLRRSALSILNDYIHCLLSFASLDLEHMREADGRSPRRP